MYCFQTMNKKNLYPYLPQLIFFVFYQISLWPNSNLLITDYYYHFNLYYYFHLLNYFLSKGSCFVKTKKDSFEDKLTELLNKFALTHLKVLIFILRAGASAFQYNIQHTRPYFLMGLKNIDFQYIELTQKFQKIFIKKCCLSLRNPDR